MINDILYERESDMDITLIRIFQIIQTIHSLEQEFTTFWGRLKFWKQIKLQKFKNRLREKIRSLDSEEWTIEYLCRLEQSIETFYDELEDFFIGSEIFVAKYRNNEKKDINLFYPMYFRVEDNPSRIIVLDIISDNIRFTIFDTQNGQSFSTSSRFQTQASQKKIEEVCKQSLISFLLRYLDNNKMAPYDSISSDNIKGWSRYGF